MGHPQLISAKVVIDNRVLKDSNRTEEVLQHEVGHADDARRNTGIYVANSKKNDEEKGKTPHDKRPNEIVANNFQKTVAAEKQASLKAAEQQRKNEEKQRKQEEKRKNEEEKRRKKNEML